MGKHLIKVKAIEFESDWYLIPNDMTDDFLKLSTIFYDSEPFTDEFYKAADDIENKFGEYKTGGDLNIFQLYMKQK